mmetsp:Transcript_16882/g.58929  ORF Transcript_16882/g.58929 Transcript_16882/m.58929 type:complete len:388 (+) Transcript_16882:514-1677(+)
MLGCLHEGPLSAKAFLRVGASTDSARVASWLACKAGARGAQLLAARQRALGRPFLRVARSITCQVRAAMLGVGCRSSNLVDGHLVRKHSILVPGSTLVSTTLHIAGLHAVGRLYRPTATAPARRAAAAAPVDGIGASDVGSLLGLGRGAASDACTCITGSDARSLGGGPRQALIGAFHQPRKVLSSMRGPMAPWRHELVVLPGSVEDGIPKLDPLGRIDGAPRPLGLHNHLLRQGVVLQGVMRQGRACVNELQRPAQGNEFGTLMLRRIGVHKDGEVRQRLVVVGQKLEVSSLLFSRRPAFVRHQLDASNGFLQLLNDLAPQPLALGGVDKVDVQIRLKQQAHLCTSKFGGPRRISKGRLQQPAQLVHLPKAVLGRTKVQDHGARRT